MAANAPTLEAIRYTRGSLQLLDQLQLPGSTVFMQIEDCAACWTAIKDMNVRGAPAIAIAAALALAVELDAAKATLPTAADVAAFVAEKMDYLCTSRPTAVGLALSTALLSCAKTQAMATSTVHVTTKLTPPGVASTLAGRMVINERRQPGRAV
jgi:methylthioribose-1-phosphate isomerase